MADEYLPLADRGKYYRALAAVIRDRIPHLQAVEARLELAALALDYENLAAYVETHLAHTGDEAENGEHPPSRAPKGGLHQLARQRLIHGLLPAASNGDTVFGGCGADTHRCAVCGGTIAPNDIEYRVQCSRGAETLTFHVACHSAWTEESRTPA